MTEPVTQWEIHHEIRNHLSLIEPLLERIGSGSASQVSAGYVEMDKEADEHFTDAGWSTCTALRVLALGSAKYLWDVSGRTTGHVDARLLNDVQGFLAVLACALSGMDRDAAASVNPPWVATCLWRMLGELQERVEEEQEPEAHEKGAAPATTTTEEPRTVTGTRSQPKEPLDAIDIHYKVQEALRPLRMLSDSEILLHGRYRDGENDAESDRAEDLARLAKQAYEALRAYEDSGHDCVLTDGRDLLWWGQAVCVALNAMSLRLSEDLGSVVPDGIRINEPDVVRVALEVLSKNSFERVRADGSEIEQAQAEMLKEMEASS